METAQTLRDEALARVIRHAGEKFSSQVQFVTEWQPQGVGFTGEDIRLTCENIGIKPHHHNAWGAVIRGLVTRGIIEHTGEHIAMRALKSHARMTPLYIKVPQETQEALTP